MRKLSLIFAAVMIAALAGCAGDTSPSGGDLAIVQLLELDASSTGRTIVLVWSAVDDVDGYKVSFRNDATGSYTELSETSTTTYTHTADNAGDYVVIAYKGDNTSEANSNAVSTMPNIINSTYTIYDNHSEESTYSGFIFGATSGTPGSAFSDTFEQDLYAYDESKGDDDVWLYSGSFGEFGNGKTCYFQEPGTTYGSCDPNSWIPNSYILYTGDSVVFVKLPYDGGDNAYVKMYGLSVTADPATTNGTIVSFSYEYQPKELGLTVFTSNAN